MWLQHVLLLARCISTRFCIAVMFLQIHYNGAGKNRPIVLHKHHMWATARTTITFTYRMFLRNPISVLLLTSLFFFSLLLRPADLLITNYTLQHFKYRTLNTYFNNNNNNNVTLRTNTYRQSRLLFMISLGQTPPKSKSISLMDNAGMPGTYKISTNFAIINATTLHNYEYVISD